MDQHSINLQAILSGLVRDEVVADHLFREISDLLWSLDDLHTPLKST